MASPSISDPKELVAAREAARRDQRLLQRGYQLAKRKGDIKGAMDFVRQGDAAGLPVGRRAHDEEILGAGESNYRLDADAAGVAPARGGLDGFDFRQKKDRMTPQQAQAPTASNPDPSFMGPRQIPGRTSTFKPGEDPGLLPPPVTGIATSAAPEAAPAAMPPGRGLDRRAAFSRAWQVAPTQEAKDELVERAQGLGVEMNMDAAKPSLERRLEQRRISNRLLPEPVNPGTGSGRAGPSAKALSEEPEFDNPGLLPDPVPRMGDGMRSKYDDYSKTYRESQALQSPVGQLARGAETLDWETKKAEMARTEAERQAAIGAGSEKQRRLRHTASVPETMDPALNRPKQTEYPADVFGKRHWRSRLQMNR